MSFQTTFTGHAEISWLANATFELGYAVSIDGGAATVRRMNSQLTGIAAGQRLHSFTTHYATTYAPMTGGSVRVFPAIRVVAGSVTIQSWVTETLLAVQTR
ncbi:hypothetical protein ACFYSJ_39480 [Streptomyces sp. NPDC005248]|uniref:hypothetical protein n=1 Tax=Streptomyces sp. NPDC005248 TaxID=3364709 RepID=UPI0036D206B0